MIAQDATAKVLNVNKIVAATTQDKTLQEVIRLSKTNYWNKSKEINLHYSIRHELSNSQGILLKNKQVVIQKDLRNRVLATAQSQHQGIIKTISIIQEEVWWPHPATNTEEYITFIHVKQIVHH